MILSLSFALMRRAAHGYGQMPGGEANSAPKSPQADPSADRYPSVEPMRVAADGTPCTRRLGNTVTTGYGDCVNVGSSRRYR